MVELNITFEGCGNSSVLLRECGHLNFVNFSDRFKCNNGIFQYIEHNDFSSKLLNTKKGALCPRGRISDS